MITLVTTTVVKGQDPHFSQFYANATYLNPALAGTLICPRFSLNFRDQWPSVQGTYMTYSVAYDQHFDKLAGGVGILFFGDRQGYSVYNTNTIQIMYSYKLEVSRAFSVRMALQAGYQHKTLDWDKLTFGDQIDPQYGFIYNTAEKQPSDLSKGVLDFAAGVVGYSENYFFGVAAHHLTQPSEGFLAESKLPLRITVHGGATIDVKRKSRRQHYSGDISIAPNLLYYHQADFQQLNLGAYLNYYPFCVGIWWRYCMENTDAVIASFGVEQKFDSGYTLKAGYSYDITVSKLANETGGAHELSCQVVLPCPEKHKRHRELTCPSF